MAWLNGSPVVRYPGGPSLAASTHTHATPSTPTILEHRRWLHLHPTTEIIRNTECNPLIPLEVNTDTPGDVVFHCPQEIPGILRGWVVDVEERGEGWSCNILGKKESPPGWRAWVGRVGVR